MEINTKEYWNNRVVKSPNEKDMLFLDVRREAYWTNVRKQLDKWKDKMVLDLCCGYGQFSEQFNRYIGIDFSEEMIKLATKKYPKKSFMVFDVNDVPELGFEKFDVVFEVNSLHSMKMAPEDFYNKFKECAEIVACLEADDFYIWTKGKLKVIKQIYGSR